MLGILLHKKGKSKKIYVLLFISILLLAGGILMLMS